MTDAPAEKDLPPGIAAALQGPWEDEVERRWAIEHACDAWENVNSERDCGTSWGGVLSVAVVCLAMAWCTVREKEVLSAHRIACINAGGSISSGECVKPERKP